MLVMTITIIKVTEETNRTAANQQMQQLQMAVEIELEKAQTELALVASGQPTKAAIFGGTAGVDPFVENLEAAWLYFNFDEIYALDGRNIIVTGSQRGTPAGALTFASLQPLVSHLVETVAGKHAAGTHNSQQSLASPEYEKLNGASGLIRSGNGQGLMTSRFWLPSARWTMRKSPILVVAMGLAMWSSLIEDRPHPQSPFRSQGQTEQRSVIWSGIISGPDLTCSPICS